MIDGYKTETTMGWMTLFSIAAYWIGFGLGLQNNLTTAFGILSGYLVMDMWMAYRFGDTR